MGRRKSSLGSETVPLEPTERDGVTLALYVLGGGGAIAIDRPLRVGRDEDCDVVLDDASVSRVHVLIEPSGAGRVLVRDDGSRNGTFVAGARLEKGRAASVGAGTAVRAGNVPLLIDLAGRAPSDEPAPASEIAPVGPMKALLETARRVARDDITVLITGETGVGKEVMARWIHDRSPRAEGPFVAVHAAALSPALFESELFGHERGAFTGAVADRDGLFQQADGGTIFFDEIGELPLEMQPKLLRVLEDRSVVRVGGRKARVVDVRVLAATNRDLSAEVETGGFRADLYFRLGAFPLVIPPLRQRLEELPGLARALLAASRAARGGGPRDFDAAAMRALERHPWPGNVRELKSVIERAMLMAPDGARSLSEDAIAKALAPASTLASMGRRAAVAASADGDDEKARILAALARHGGNQGDAAAELGIARRTLLYKLDKLGVPRPRKGRK